MKTITLFLFFCLFANPSFAAMNHGNMIMDDKSMIMNNNPDQLPRDCQEISEDIDITIRGGHKYATDFAGKMFTYDKRDLQVPPCARVNITFINEDDIRHQFMLHGLPGYIYPKGMFTIEIYGKGQKTGSFIVPSRDYTYYIHCEVSQHTEKGMKGQLKVGKGSGNLDSILGLTAPLTPDLYPINNTHYTWLALLYSIIIGAVLIKILNSFLVKSVKH
ncbi:MAG: multicopper oxidase domain-containing protein [Methyloprofundus sp.]|uniref:multicopper oxidase domain-containing protein n=1 Tax=Methyloprofundus sp. TaxID=2020875 RepID=UPI001A155FE5|nr:multicopper oxidase domain-containing protein [Methyloprofundus sp.]HIL77766.1 copper oxidase [Methylococcales bacterium]